MTRLMNKDFLTRHYFLKELWHDDIQQGLYGALSPAEQWDLHWFYQITHPGSVVSLVEARADVSVHDPSLPQRAGRAYAKLQRTLELRGKPKQSVPLNPVLMPGNHRKRNITVQSVVNPHPDVRKLAEALWRFALQDAKESIPRDDADANR